MFSLPPLNMVSENPIRTATQRSNWRGPRLVANWKSGEHCAACRHGKRCESRATRHVVSFVVPLYIICVH